MIPLPPINADGSYTFVAGMQIDGDGANGQSSPPVYAPHGFQPEPLDFLANAGGPGNWFGVVTDDSGHPFVQRRGEPMPGAYVSATSYEHHGLERRDPRRYVDANAVCYIVLPSHWRLLAKGVVLGCKATVQDLRNGKTIDAVVADFGPRNKMGEASIATARELGVPHSPKNGGTDSPHFRYTFHPGIAADGFELMPV